MVQERAPAPLGWDTSDEQEVELRRWRGRTEISAVEALEPEHPVFGAFRVRAESGGGYGVEIRTLDGADNRCGCIDDRVNGLGTCKHINGAVAALRRGGVRAFRAAAAVGSSRVEAFLQRNGEPTPTLSWPRGTGEADGATPLARLKRGHLDEVLRAAQTNFGQ